MTKVAAPMVKLAVGRVIVWHSLSFTQQVLAQGPPPDPAVALIPTLAQENTMLTDLQGLAVIIILALLGWRIYRKVAK